MRTLFKYEWVGSFSMHSPLQNYMFVPFIKCSTINKMWLWHFLLGYEGINIWCIFWIQTHTTSQMFGRRSLRFMLCNLCFQSKSLWSKCLKLVLQRNRNCAYMHIGSKNDGMWTLKDEKIFWTKLDSLWTWVSIRGKTHQKILKWLQLTKLHRWI